MQVNTQIHNLENILGYFEKKDPTSPSTDNSCSMFLW